MCISHYTKTSFTENIRSLHYIIKVLLQNRITAAAK